jgi:hypothetical protein
MASATKICLKLLFCLDCYFTDVAALHSVNFTR